MLEETVKEYCPYVKLNISQEIDGVQYVVDNMLTRLEEFASVLNMIKQKNDDCAGCAAGEIESYRTEITTLSKKIDTLDEVVSKVRGNVDHLDKLIEKAEADFGISTDNRLKMLFKPFLNRNREATSAPAVIQPIVKIQLDSVLDNFQEK